MIESLLKEKNLKIKIIMSLIYIILIVTIVFVVIFLKDSNESPSCDTFYEYINFNSETNLEKGSNEWLFNSLYNLDECYENLEIVSSSNNIKYSDNKIIALEEGESTLTIKINDVEEVLVQFNRDMMLKSIDNSSMPDKNTINRFVGRH